MSEIPPPDLLDRRGRMNRLVIAFVCGALIAGAAWYVTYKLAGADWERGDRGAGRFMFLVASVSFGLTFKVVHMLLVRRDKRRWAAEGFPEARIKR